MVKLNNEYYMSYKIVYLSSKHINYDNAHHFINLNPHPEVGNILIIKNIWLSYISDAASQ